MIQSLEIKNFRSLKDLTIRSLSNINLFTGKNNTGKSSILEAIALFASKGDINTIFQFLQERGESFIGDLDTSKDYTGLNIKALSSQFTDRIIGFKKEDSLTIGTIDNLLFGEERSNTNFLSIRFVKYRTEFLETDKVTDQGSSRRRVIEDNEVDTEILEYSIGLLIRFGNNSSLVPLERSRPFRFTSRNFGTPDNFQFIRTKNIEREINGKLWDNITLSEKENYVIEALKIIEPNVERIAFIEENLRERNAVIKLTNNKNVLPLKSMGDGLNRILTIILALVNSDNGYLFIDEFENGLHYSVQEKLWEVIFKISKLLNIQVFVTTHSEDCISSFESVLNRKINNLSGKLIRLELKENIIKQVEFSEKELKIASEQDIETR